MATDDCYEVHREPCLCSAGEFVVERCEPDYPFANLSNRSYRASIECGQCSKAYVLRSVGFCYEIVERRILEEERRIDSERSDELRELMCSDDARDVLVAFTEHLSKLNKIDTHRVLESAGLQVRSVSSFYGSFVDAATEVRRGVTSPSDVLKVARRLGMPTLELENRLSEIEAKHKASRATLISTVPAKKLSAEFK
jgi:hypothetical protein